MRPERWQLKKAKKRKINKEKKFRDVISHACAHATFVVMLSCGTWCPGYINYAKFRQSWLRGFPFLNAGSKSVFNPTLNAMAYITDVM